MTIEKSYYKILEAESIEELELLLNDEKFDYQPIGGICVIQKKFDQYPFDTMQYYQTVMNHAMD